MFNFGAHDLTLKQNSSVQELISLSHMRYDLHMENFRFLATVSAKYI